REIVAKALYRESGQLFARINRRNPHLESVSTGEERDPLWEKCIFAQECLRAHNLYRARHSSPPLQLCKKLCNLAQAWANHLAQTGRLRYKGDPEIGENIFCRNVALAIRSQLTVPDI
ncbi:Golgi-associated plant pathogenesis-related protein 1, partial [Armadillidium vulgare]